MRILSHRWRASFLAGRCGSFADGATVVRPPTPLHTDGARTSFCALFLGVLLLSGCSRLAPQPEENGKPRLVSTAPNLTECVFAAGAGDLLVGRTESCDYPAAISHIPVIGGFATPCLEPLLAVRPTQVLETVLADPDIRSRLEALHIPVVHVPCSRLDEVPEAIRQIGALTGHGTEADRVASALRAGIAKARADAVSRADHPRVLLLFASDSPITAGKHAFVSELLELAGGVNIDEGSAADYYHVSLEWLLEHDPDIILCLFETHLSDPTVLFEKQTGWKALSAVRRHRVYTVADLDTVSRPGPRLLDGLAQLKQVLLSDSSRRSATSADSWRSRTN